MAEPFTHHPNVCPKCRGISHIRSYTNGVRLLQDEHGRFTIQTTGGEEYLIVACGVCGFERLMEVAS